MKELPYLTQVLGNDRVEMKHIVLFQHVDILFGFPKERAEVAVAYPTQFHIDEHLGDIGFLIIFTRKYAENKVVVSRDAVLRLIVSLFIIYVLP